MIVTDDRYAVGARGSGNGNCPVEVQATAKIGPGKRNRVGALRRDDIRARNQSLSYRHVSNTKRGTNKNKVAGINDSLALCCRRVSHDPHIPSYHSLTGDFAETYPTA